MSRYFKSFIVEQIKQDFIDVIITLPQCGLASVRSQAMGCTLMHEG